MGVIFVCGIHGAGKTTFCAKLSSDLEIPAFSASSLIKEVSDGAISNSSGYKKVNDVEGNQELLIYAISEKLKTYKSLILDGHTSIINSENEIIPLNVEIFKKLSLEKIIVINTSPEKVVQRIMKRDGISISLENIKMHALIEIENAKNISKYLNIWIEVIESL